jgi:hypothetical protein
VYRRQDGREGRSEGGREGTHNRSGYALEGDKLSRH